MVVIIGFEGSANKIGIGIIEDGKVRSIRGIPNYPSYFYDRSYNYNWSIMVCLVYQ